MTYLVSKEHAGLMLLSFLREVFKEPPSVKSIKCGIDAKGVEIDERAITRFKCLARGELSTLVECFPETGRTHQICVHLKEMGHPVLGDWQYSRVFTCPFKVNRQMLHTWKLSLIHPKTDRLLTFEAPLPEYFYPNSKKTPSRCVF